MKFKLGSAPTEWKETNCPEGADEINKTTSEESSRNLIAFSQCNTLRFITS